MTDIFVLRLDERLGEIILSKALGFLLVLAYLWILRRPIRETGLHGDPAGASAVIGGAGTLVLFLLGFGVQLALLQAPQLVLAGIDPKTGQAGGLLFGAWLVGGNFVNSFMEEGLFRGVMLRHFLTCFSGWKAIWLQAAFFSIWHAVWPIKHWVAGTVTPSGAASEAVMLLLATLISGLVYGCLYYRTGSLWTSWTAHTLNNTILNLVHIRTAAGLDADVMLMQTLVVLGLFALIPWTKWWSGRLKLKEIRPWDSAQ